MSTPIIQQPLVIPAANPGVGAVSSRGAGRAPAGLSAAGFGSPSTAATRGQGVVGGSSQIDPYRGDYCFDSNGNKLAMGTAQQLVVVALRTEFGSSSLDGFGLDRSLAIISDKVAVATIGRYQRAVAHLTSQGIIEIVSISSVEAQGAVTGSQTIFKWRDLTTGVEYDNAVTPTQ